MAKAQHENNLIAVAARQREFTAVAEAFKLPVRRRDLCDSGFADSFPVVVLTGKVIELGDGFDQSRL